jgi:NADPH-dependent 2,4-dienoyl-CoA reductase/sulfur reductase-like enzyme/nitrite reductase/ring-hydroxylating ferredoxin subunit
VSSDQAPLTGPDLALGVSLSEIPDGGMLAGHAFGTAVLLVRQGDDVFAVGAACAHYGAPLIEGIVVGDTVRCPWHHACFSAKTGEALRPPALNPLPRWEVTRQGDAVVVGREVSAEHAPPPARSSSRAGWPRSVIVVGAGAAGDVAADTLRREGYDGSILVIGEDEAAPYDRPNISKDYLAGNAPEEWIPLRASTFYEERGIQLLRGRRVRKIDRARQEVRLDDGSSHHFGALLLATGARPVRLPEPFDRAVLYLRTLADSRAIIAAAEGAKSALVLGASFIGLEVAASLRARGLDVHVAAPERVPLERVLGPELGGFVRGLHEAQGVTFHLERTARSVEPGAVTLSGGERIAADFVVAGVGVQPNAELAANAGLAVDRGVIVDEYLQTVDAGIFAAGDVARYPDPRTGDGIRVEHWVVAQRMGQTAARNMLGQRQRFDAVPFFWSKHYETSIRYVGHAQRWDQISIAGSLERQDCTATFIANGETLAVATVGRDRDSLSSEVTLERLTTDSHQEM